MRIEADAARYAGARGRASYETRTGATIVGAEVTEAFASPGHVDLFEENAAWQIRLWDPEHGERPRRPATLMARLAGGPWTDHWIAFPAFPGLIATALIDDDGFSGLNYRPAGRDFPVGVEAGFRESENALAETSAMFRRGILPNRRRALELVRMAQDNNYSNPALAVLAAHVHYRQNDIATILEMERRGIGGGPYTLPDFLILTDREAPPKGTTLVGTAPVMAPAWGLLPAADFEIDPRLHDVTRGLVPSLWTMAKPEAGALLAEIVGATSPEPSPEPAYA